MGEAGGVAEGVKRADERRERRKTHRSEGEFSLYVGMKDNLGPKEWQMVIMKLS